MRAGIRSTLLGFASNCPGSNVCFQLNVPADTASTGNGDVFFQISAPTTFSWVAMGQGTGMTGANIFVLYTDSTGKNVTLSPRLGTGHSMPEFNPHAQVTLLDGSGISGNVMIANVKCSSCTSWSGGSMDFTSSSASFVYAALSGDPIRGDENAVISQHNVQGDLPLDLAQAKGGSSVNPFLKSGGSGTTGECRQRTSTASDAPVKRAKDDEPLPFCDELPGGTAGLPSGGDGNLFDNQPAFFQHPDTFRMAHGILASLAFVVLFPAGAIVIRLLSFPGLAWLHGAFQLFAYCVYIAAFGIGIYIKNNVHPTDNSHPIIGIILLALLFFQPILGFMHHSQFQKVGHRTHWSHGHVWFGRILITLGIINGGLGLRLSNNTEKGKVAYGIVAGVVWVAYIAAAIIGERRRARQQSLAVNEPSKSESSTTAS